MEVTVESSVNRITHQLYTQLQIIKGVSQPMT